MSWPVDKLRCDPVPYLRPYHVPEALLASRQCSKPSSQTHARSARGQGAVCPRNLVRPADALSVARHD